MERSRQNNGRDFINTGSITGSERSILESQDSIIDTLAALKAAGYGSGSSGNGRNASFLKAIQKIVSKESKLYPNRLSSSYFQEQRDNVNTDDISPGSLHQSLLLKSDEIVKAAKIVFEAFDVISKDLGINSLVVVKFETAVKSIDPITKLKANKRDLPEHRSEYVNEAALTGSLQAIARLNDSVATALAGIKSAFEGATAIKHSIKWYLYTYKKSSESSFSKHFKQNQSD